MPSEKSNRDIMMLPLAEILPGENPRQEFDQVCMSELMQSLKHQGLMQPIGVRKLSTGRFKLVFGTRRFMAAQKLGWDKIEAVEVTVDDEKDALLKTSAENVIRENISLPEQGRIFQVLLKKGLTSEQISIRMGCSKNFVMKALNAFNHIPKKYHDRITYGTRGQEKEEGTIPATVALAVYDIRKETKLTDQQVGALMDWASRTGINVVRTRTVGRLIAAGMPITKATEQVDFMKTITITFSMRIATIQKLQKKYKKPIHDIIYSYLERHSEFDIVTGEKLASERPREHVLRKKVKRRNK
jgi:ParB/RepB/Spo0J family partition protein